MLKKVEPLDSKSDDLLQVTDLLRVKTVLGIDHSAPISVGFVVCASGQVMPVADYAAMKDA